MTNTLPSSAGSKQFPETRPGNFANLSLDRLTILSTIFKRLLARIIVASVCLERVTLLSLKVIPQAELETLSREGADLYSEFVYVWEDSDSAERGLGPLKREIRNGVWDCAIAELISVGLLRIEPLEEALIA